MPSFNWFPIRIHSFLAIYFIVRTWNPLLPLPESMLAMVIPNVSSLLAPCSHRQSTVIPLLGSSCFILQNSKWNESGLKVCLEKKTQKYCSMHATWAWFILRIKWSIREAMHSSYKSQNEIMQVTMELFLQQFHVFVLRKLFQQVRPQKVNYYHRIFYHFSYLSATTPLTIIFCNPSTLVEIHRLTSGNWITFSNIVLNV